jgi:hypothetical protein
MVDYSKQEAQVRADRIRLFYEELDGLCLEGVLRLEDQQLKGQQSDREKSTRTI